jgi:hypothetical protein
MKRITLPLMTALLSISITSCAAQPEAENVESNTSVAAQETKIANNMPDPTSPQVAVREAALKINNAELPLMTVYKSPTCGCCTSWVEHMENSGFKVSVVETNDMNPIKLELGVPVSMSSCHTAKIGNYFVEGHVPAEDVKRLLKEQPDALGIGVPGMPLGSPGMEVPSGETQPYTVTRVNKDGSLSIFSSH